VLPALHALRNNYPEAEIVYLGNAWHKPFLSNRPGPVDRVIIVPPCEGIPHESNSIENEVEVAAFFADMQKECFDIAIQLHGGGKYSNPFIKKLGARITLGLKTKNASSLDLNVPYFLHQNEILRYLEVVAQIGARTEIIEPKLTVTESDTEELSKIIPHRETPFAVIHPGASDTRRRWPAEKFAFVGDALADKGFRIMVSGTLSEKDIAEQVITNMSAEADNLCGKLSLNGLIALLDEASIMISNDTGPLHLAKAVDTPTVGIYWCGNIITAGLITASSHRTCLGWNVYCPDCGINCTVDDAHVSKAGCKHDKSFIGDLCAGDVIEQAMSLLTS